MVAPAGRDLHAGTRQPVSRCDGDRAGLDDRSRLNPRGFVYDPNSKSRTHAIRLVDHSPSAGCVITVIIIPTDHAGVTAWKTSGADLRAYEEQERP